MHSVIFLCCTLSYFTIATAPEMVGVYNVSQTSGCGNRVGSLATEIRTPKPEVDVRPQEAPEMKYVFHRGVPSGLVSTNGERLGISERFVRTCI